MKLLIIVNVDWFLYSHRLPIVLEAKKKGYEVHIATKITDISKRNSLLKKGIIIHELTFDRSGKSLKKLIIVFFEIILLLYKLKPNILHLVTIQPNILGGIAARIVGINKVVYAISGLGHTFLSKNLNSSILRFFLLKAYRFAFATKNRIVIFQNSSDLDFLSKKCLLSSKEVILIPGSGVDLNKFAYSELPNSIPIVLMASRLLISKGIYEFINAAKIIKEKNIKIKFQLAGKPDKYNPLSISEKEIDNWVSKGYVEYLGFQNMLEKVIPNSHIVVLPSYYPEGLPKILCEAAACGRAVITTNMPGCKDAILDGITGLLIEEKNSEELAMSIIDLVKNKKLLKSMSKAARIRAEKSFDIKKIVNKHMEIYEYVQNLEN